MDNPDLLKAIEAVTMDTPFGNPSSVLKQGKMGDCEVVLLARHGIGHTIPPSQVNFRANVWALKEIGCTHILVTTAVGSLREQIKPGDFVVLDQFIDFSRHRKIPSTNSSSLDFPFMYLPLSRFRQNCDRYS